MKNQKKWICISLLGFLMAGCVEFDPTRDVENPNLTLDNVIGAPGSTTSWIVGLDRQMAIVYNQLLEVTELGSDNYENIQTFYNQAFDGLDFNFQDADAAQLMGAAPRYCGWTSTFKMPMWTAYSFALPT